jgi:hypothetical protein
MKNICKNCKFNDDKVANEMFFTNYCTIKECQTSGEHKCEYKVTIEKLNMLDNIV